MKKLLKKTLAVCLSAVTAATAFVMPAFALVGDINGDGRANTSDARLVLRYNAKLETLTPEQIERCDFNADGRVNSSDARLLLRQSAKLESLSSYSNYYTEMQPGTDEKLTVGYCNGDFYAHVLMSNISMGLLLKKNGTVVMIDDTEKQYAQITKEEIDALVRLTGEPLDFSQIIDEANVDSILLKPAALLDEGYVKTDGEYNGKAAQVYTLEKEDVTIVYYYDGLNLLATKNVAPNDPSVVLSQTTFSNFTTEPQQYMYAYKNNGYKQRDMIEMMMEYSDLF